MATIPRYPDEYFGPAEHIWPENRQHLLLGSQRKWVRCHLAGRMDLKKYVLSEKRTGLFVFMMPLTQNTNACVTNDMHLLKET